MELRSHPVCSNRALTLYCIKTETMNLEDGFDIFSEETERQIGQTNQTAEMQPSTIVEALQVVRIGKSASGHRTREVLDTIKVSYPSMTYERALKIALHKGKILGNCMVVEKLEKLVATF